MLAAMDETASLAALERALRCPAYAGWRRLDPGPGASVGVRYAALPALTKAHLRRDCPAGFVPPGADLEAALARGEVEYVSTAGTTADAVTVPWHQRWWNASERASWQLNAHARELMTGTHREAVLASARCVGPPFRAEPRALGERTLGRLLFLNERADVGWSDADVRRMAGELERFDPVVLEADPVYLAALVRRARALGFALHQPRLIVFTYSYPTRAHLRLAREAFAAPLMSSYGSTECGYVFVGCEHGRLHENVGSCRVDVLPLTPEHGGPRLVRLLVTPFGHPYFAALRIDVGDLALESGAACPCGNTHGVTLDALAGRADDVTFTARGRLVAVRELDEALALTGADDYRLVQHDARRFRLLILDGHAAPACRAALEQLYGAPVAVETVNALPVERSGKYRLASRDFDVDLAALTSAGRR